MEFDHYDGASTYYGLDKLCLNNLIQDNTCMKDFLVYQLMGKFGAASPLCSYVSVSVNGELWGLYLAVEGVEDAFLRRNYGSGHGNLYKPDSMSFGGGRGNGGGFDFQALAEGAASPPAPESGGQREGRPEGGAFGGRGGMGSSDVKLQYIDDDPDSYANIFDSAKTDVTDAGQKRLIASLKALGGGGDMTGVVDVEQVIRYFVVHGFVCNGDSYTGSMVHNYYLYEEDGIMSMIPWDYNLAFGVPGRFRYGQRAHRHPRFRRKSFGPAHAGLDFQQRRIYAAVSSVLRCVYLRLSGERRLPGADRDHGGNDRPVCGERSHQLLHL